MKPRRRSFTIATALAALTFAGAALAGCSTEAPADGGTEETPSFSSNEEYQLALAECMRSKGIDMPDPGESGTQIDAGQEGLPEAAEACGDELGTPPGGSGGARPSDEQREVFLQMAQCFRDNGLDVPDPAPGESLTVPMDAPQELFDKCATAGESGTTGGAP
jgi:hypothetical protein